MRLSLHSERALNSQIGMVDRPVMLVRSCLNRRFMQELTLGNLEVERLQAV